MLSLIVVEVFIGSTSVILGGFYHPPDSAESYLLELQSSLHCLPSKSLMFVCGDFNIPDISWETLSSISNDKNAALLCSIAQYRALE